MLVIYKESKNGKLEFTKEEFEEYLEKARKEGYDEGYKDGNSKVIPSLPPIQVPPAPTIPSPYWYEKPMCRDISVSSSKTFGIDGTSLPQNDTIKSDIVG